MWCYRTDIELLNQTKLHIKIELKLHLIYESAEIITLEVANELEYETTLTLQNEFKNV